MLVDPVFAVFALPEAVSAGLLLVPPEPAGLDGGEAGGEELVLAGAGEDALTLLGPAVLDGGAVVGGQGVPVALAGFLLPAALVVAFAEAAEVVLLVAVPVPVAGGVAVAVSLALALSLAGLPLVPLPVTPVGGLLTELAGVAVGGSGLSDFVGLAAAAADDGDPDTHVGGSPLLPAAEVPAGPAPPAAELAWVPAPFRLGALPPGLELENPTALPSWWTKASRSGGTANATPMANTAQAAARAGRSSPYRQSRCCRALPLPVSWPLPASCPPRAAFQRRTRIARNPPRAAGCLLA